MAKSIQSIRLNKLIAHPDNPNQMSKSSFTKLLGNIKRTRQYEPLVVRRHPERAASFQIINGHHRCKALAQLDYKTADCVVWDIDDEQTDILLATLNRLGGSDQLDKKLKLLKRLNERMDSGELAGLLPQTAKQIERLVNLKMPDELAKVKPTDFLNPMVFFLDDTQQAIVENALMLADDTQSKKTKAQRNTTALVNIASQFVDNSTGNSGGV